MDGFRYGSIQGLKQPSQKSGPFRFLPLCWHLFLGWQGRHQQSQVTWVTLAVMGPLSCSIYARAQGQLGSSRDSGGSGARVTGPLPSSLLRRLTCPADNMPGLGDHGRPQGAGEGDTRRPRLCDHRGSRTSTDPHPLGPRSWPCLREGSRLELREGDPAEPLAGV